MIKELFIPHALTAARTREEKSLKDLFDLMMQLNRLHPAPAVLDGAGPSALHLNARVTVKAIAPGALPRERLHHELAEATDEQVKGGCQS